MQTSRKCDGIRGFSRRIRRSIARKIRRVYNTRFYARPLFEITPLVSPVRGIGKITRTGRGSDEGGSSGVARSEITWARRGREGRPPNLNSPRYQNGGDPEGWRWWHTCLTASGQ